VVVLPGNREEVVEVVRLLAERGSPSCRAVPAPASAAAVCRSTRR
jgi:hypothetical protein